MFPTASENDVAEEKISAATEAQIIKAQKIQHLDETKFSKESITRAFLLTSVPSTGLSNAWKTALFKHPFRMIIWVEKKNPGTGQKNERNKRSLWKPREFKAQP